MKMIQVDKLMKIRFVKGEGDFSEADFIKLIPIGTDNESNYQLIEMADANLDMKLVIEDCFTAQVAFTIVKNTISDGKYKMSLMSSTDNTELASISCNIIGNDNIEQFIKRT